MTVETLPFDAADCIRSPEAQDELISDAIDGGDPGYVALALGVVARVHGMSQLSRETGLTREGLYKRGLRMTQCRWDGKWSAGATVVG